ncbi:MAG: hypothetical protein K9M54_10435 [Kiritimatiellales bacterium]|nr:hypothetical protein [Kiritimatiellales bacterium]MCF7863745.1 hypothetical protein [Kiritimatiellales bacterium]
MAFVDDFSGFYLVDDFLVAFGQGATAFMACFNGSVKAGLFNVPRGDFQMLVNVHFFPWVNMLILK